MLIGLAVGVVVVATWLLVFAMRAGGAASERTADARHALAEFAVQSLELESLQHILEFSAEASRVAFGAERTVLFERGLEDGWQVRQAGDPSTDALPSSLHGLFGWFKHNTEIAVRADVGQARFGAMRGPIGQVMDKFDVDVLIPLVHEGQVLAAVGLKLGRRPGADQRELLRLLRLEATAACANVRLHREASHMISLAKEVDLAAAVRHALVPDETDGVCGALQWSGHFRAATEAASDFWLMHELSPERSLVLIGDATGAGLAGSMVSAVVKSCADAILDAKGVAIDPASLLGTLNRALWRPDNPAHMTAFAALFDRDARTVRYANAGHPFPYRLHATRGLGVLGGAGPVLGDEPQSHYKVHERPLAAQELFVFFTDGLVSARSADGKAFGERRLQKALLAGEGEAASAVRDRIVERLDAHRGAVAIRDDEALVVVQVASSGASDDGELDWEVDSEA